MFGEIGTPATPLTGTIASAREARTQGHVITTVPMVPPTSNPPTMVPSIDPRQCAARVRGGTYSGTLPVFAIRGIRWIDALPANTAFSTIIGPNGASCSDPANAAGQGNGIYTAGSYHFGGAHVVMFDNAVRFIPNEIDTTNNDPSPTANSTDYYAPGFFDPPGTAPPVRTPNWTSPSPFGTWGAMGSRGGGELPAEMPGA